MTGFSGFPPEALGFLRAVDFHQDRAWFQANKALYDSALQAPFRALMLDCAAEFARRGLPITADPARGLFRLQRDVRFAKDKRPYKTSAGAVMTRSGRKDDPGLVYVHLDPKGCFIGAGVWHPTPPQLQAMRQAILAHPKRFLSLREGLAQAGLVLDDAEALARMPRAFAEHAGSPVADAIRMTNYLVRRPVPDSLMASPALVATLADFTEETLPLLRFLWTAMAEATAGR
jgi:uncharacterized protein (TIGR02453 family)